jgi:plastocyanin
MPSEGEHFDPIAGFFHLLEQLLLPAWNDLIAYVPLLLIGLLLLTMLWLVVVWRRAGSRNRSRVARPISGAPPAGVHMIPPSRWPFVLPIGLALIFFALVLPERDAQHNLILPFNPILFVAGLLVSLVGVAGWLRDAMREWRQTADQTAHASALVPVGESALVPAQAAAGQAPGQTVAAAAPYAPPEAPPGVHMPGPSPWPFFAPIALTVLFFGLIFNPALVVAGVLLGLIAAVGWLRDANREWRSTQEVGHAVPATRDPRAAWPRRVVPVFIAVIGLAVLVAASPVAFEWLGTLRPATPGPTQAVVPAVPEIGADSAASFDTKSLVVPAGRPFELVFHNRNDGVPHDVWITDGPARNTVYFEGDQITGVDDITYEVPALDAGDYYFFCSIHPNMNGTVHALPEPATPGQGSPPAAPGSGSPPASPAATP